MLTQNGFTTTSTTTAKRITVGISFTQQNRSVNDIIREHFPISAILGVLALAFESTITASRQGEQITRLAQENALLRVRADEETKEPANENGES